MQVITIETQAYQDLLNGLERIEQSIQNAATSESEKLLTNQGFCDYLGVDKRTAQRYRDEGKVSYFKVNKKIFYKASDVDTMMEKHRIQAFKNPKNK